MARHVDLSNLEAGLVERFSFDLRRRSCVFEVVVLERGVSRRYLIEAEDIKTLRFRNEYPGEWEFVEVSESFISVEEDSTLVMDFWGPGAGIEITATRVTIDGASAGIE